MKFKEFRKTAPQNEYITIQALISEDVKEPENIGIWSDLVKDLDKEKYDNFEVDDAYTCYNYGLYKGKDIRVVLKSPRKDIKILCENCEKTTSLSRMAFHELFKNETDIICNECNQNTNYDIHEAVDTLFD